MTSLAYDLQLQYATQQAGDQDAWKFLSKLLKKKSNTEQRSDLYWQRKTLNQYEMYLLSKPDLKGPFLEFKRDFIAEHVASPGKKAEAAKPPTEDETAESDDDSQASEVTASSSDSESSSSSSESDDEDQNKNTLSDRIKNKTKDAVDATKEAMVTAKDSMVDAKNKVVDKAKDMTSKNDDDDSSSSSSESSESGSSDEDDDETPAAMAANETDSDSSSESSESSENGSSDEDDDEQSSKQNKTAGLVSNLKSVAQNTKNKLMETKDKIVNYNGKKWPKEDKALMKKRNFIMNKIKNQQKSLQSVKGFDKNDPAIIEANKLANKFEKVF